MKRCPTCHAEYGDDIQFCVRDGSTLIPVGGTTPGTESPTSTSPSTKPNKGRNVLRTVLIVVAVLAVVFVAVSRHLNNAATYLRAEPNQISAPKAGGDIVVDIDYDGYVWKINHKPDWVKVDKMDQSFSLTVQPNRTGQSREGSITVQSGKQLAQVIIRQNGMATKIQASEKQFHFDKRGGSGSVTIITDGNDWKAEGPNWLDIRKSGEDRLYIKCPDNDDVYRIGSVVVTEDNIRYTIDVTQAGKCNSCGGTGETSCLLCGGAGGSFYGGFITQCFGCRGSGRVRCGYCGGSGERE